MFRSGRPFIRLGVSLIAAAGALFSAGAASAQQSTDDGPKVQQIKAVERGGFIETDIGTAFIVTKINQRKFGLALVSGVFAGYDIADVFSIAFGAQAVAASASEADDPLASDLLWLMPMAHIQFALLTTERNFLWIRGGAGFGIGLPESDGGSGPVFAGTIGYERYTKLRHFSIGVQAGALVVTKPGTGIGISLIPTLKYTF